VCNAEVPDGEVSCPVCGSDTRQSPEEAWDPHREGSRSSKVDLFTSAEGTREGEAAAPSPPPVPPPPPPPWAGGEEGEAEEIKPAKPLFGGQAQIATQIAPPDPQQERHTRIVDVSVPAVVRKAAKQEEMAAEQGLKSKKRVVDQEIGTGIEDLYEAVKLFYARMHRLDRITLWVALATLVASFLPWSYTLGDGLMAGIQEFGIVSAVATLLILFCLWARTAKRRLAGLLLAVQVFSSAVVIAAPIYRIISASKVDFKLGLFLAVLGGAVTAVLTLLRLAARNF
jgi:hypothetical protein